MISSPCADWPLDPTCAYKIPVNPEERTPAQAAAVSGATELLWRLTAGVFGLCPITVRPCRGGCPSVGLDTFPPRGIPPDGARWAAPTGTPALIGGQWLNVPCGCGRSPCGCGPVHEIRLPGPVAAVTGVYLDGQWLPPEAYRVDNFAYLVRTDGGTWPVCQNMGAPLGEPGTWAVTYTIGNPVPAGGRRAVGALAAELIKSCSDLTCKLPANTVTVAREGLTVAMDTTGLLDAGRTGLPEVDLWLSAVNPNNRRTRSAVYSPDLPTYRETTWTADCVPDPGQIDLIPRSVHIAGYAGDTLRVHITLSDPGPYVGGLWAGQVRDADGTMVAEWVIAPTATGAFLTLPADVTAGLGAFAGVYDVQITTPDAGVRTVVRGRLTLAPDVTRPVTP